MKLRAIISGVICGASLLVVAGTASAAPINLIANGDFQLGDNNGFSTDYIPNAIGLVENSYSIINNPIGPAPDRNPYTGPLGGKVYYDHTYGTPEQGLMMAVNGSGDATKRVWYETVSGLVVGQQYKFSFWMSSWDNASPAVVDIQIDNASQGTFNAPTAVATWVNYGFLWTATSTSAGFTAIYDNNTIAQGNDFALDDISLTAVPDGGMTVALLGFALVGVEGIRRKFRK